MRHRSFGGPRQIDASGTTWPSTIRVTDFCGWRWVIKQAQ